MAVPNSEVIWGLPKYGDLNPHRAWLQESSGLFAPHSDSGEGSLSPALEKILAAQPPPFCSVGFLGLEEEQPSEGTLEVEG